MALPLEQSLHRLRRLAVCPPSRPGTLDIDWKDLIGVPDLLRRELRAVLRRWDPPALPQLRECWELISSKECEANFGLARTVAQSRRPGSADSLGLRLYRHAVWLTAAAGAAAVVQQARAPFDAWADLSRWWREGVERSGGAAGETPPCPDQWSPRRAAGAAQCFLASGWHLQSLADWTSAWMEERPRTEWQLAIPVAGYFAGTAFWAQLRLSPTAVKGPYLVEEFDGALAPLGETLLETIRMAAGSRGSGVRWRITVQREFPEGTPPLDGESLGAAAWAGFELFRGQRDYDPRCVLLAAVRPDGNLAPVGGEPEKLTLARDSGFQRAAVSDRTSLSDADLKHFGPPVTVRLRTADDAVRFARRVAYDSPWL